MPISVQNEQFAVIQELIKRQDEALDELESLNKRVEQAIEEVNALRHIDSEQDDIDIEPLSEVSRAA